MRRYQSTPILTVCNHTSRKDNQTHRQFITNHLSNRTTTPQKSIFTITPPSCLLNSINSQTSNSQNIHCSQIQIPNSTCSTCRQSCPPNLTSLKSQNRCPQKQRLVCTTRQNGFFQQQFQTIQERLLYSKKSPGIRTLTTLHSTHNTTLDECQKSNCKQQRHYSCLNHNLQIKNHTSFLFSQKIFPF